jgi:cation:H+ antiporter
LTTISVATSTIFREIPFMIAVTALLLILGLDGTVTLMDGVILWGAFLLYLGYLFRMARNGEADVEEISADRPIWKSALWTVVGLVFIITGSNVAVEAATDIARALGLSERLIGLTIVALGTSLPELFTSVSAAKRGNADIAIGNIVGSNIFNVLFVVGTSALVTPIPFATAFRTDAMIAIVTSVLLFVCCLHRSRLSRKSGFTLLASYATYFTMVLA